MRYFQSHITVQSRIPEKVTYFYSPKFSASITVVFRHVRSCSEHDVISDEHKVSCHFFDLSEGYITR